MTTQQREWLASVRRSIRKALLDLEFGRFDIAFLGIREHFVEESPTCDAAMEVKNLLASLAVVDPALTRDNPAARAAATRRLNETKRYIADALLATTERNPRR
jgi:hypothetical protein